MSPAGGGVEDLEDALLNVEMFDALLEAQVRMERWREWYNTAWPHDAVGYRPPATETARS